MIAQSLPAPRTAAPRWRIWLYAVIGTLLTLAFLVVFGGVEALPQAFGISLYTPPDPGYNTAVHYWHQTQWAAQMGVLLGGTLLALLYRPTTKPLLAQFFIAAMILHIGIFAAGQMWPPVAFLMEAIFPILIVLLYPAPRELRNMQRPAPWSWSLLGLSAVAAIAMLPDALHGWHLQVTGNPQDAYVVHGMGAGASALAALLVLAGILTASKRPGWKTLGLLTGSCYVYLGVGAMILLHQPGSWGIVGGTASLLGGVAYIGLTLRESRALRRSTSA